MKSLDVTLDGKCREKDLVICNFEQLSYPASTIRRGSIYQGSHYKQAKLGGVASVTTTLCRYSPLCKLACLQTGGQL